MSLAAACGFASCGGDDDPGGREVAKTTTADIDRASGTRAAVEAYAYVGDSNEKSVRIRLSAAPRRRLAVAYASACERRPTRSGGYEATPPHTRSVKLQAGHRCAIAVRADIIRGSGRVKVTLLVSGR